MTDILHHRQYGEDGPQIVILHGLLGMLDNWASIAKKLSDSYSIYLVDQRNHGRSFHSDEFDHHLLADDLDRWMGHVGLDAAHLIGHSMGGKAAMQFSQDYPNRCQSLMIVDIAAREFADGHSSIFKALFDLDISKVEKRSDADTMLAESIDDWGIRQFLLKNLTRSDDGSWTWRANVQGLYNNYDQIRSAIDLRQKMSLPTLLVRGTRSNYIMDEDLEDVRRYFSEAQMVDLDAGHWVHAERREELIEIIRDYII